MLSWRDADRLRRRWLQGLDVLAGAQLKEGTEFSQALGALDGGDAAKANNALNDFMEKGPAGYRVLARFQIAAEARRQYRQGGYPLRRACSGFGHDNILKGLATIQAATLHSTPPITRRWKGASRD